MTEEGGEGPGGPGAEGEPAEREASAPIEPEPDLWAAAPPPEPPGEPSPPPDQPTYPPLADGDYPPLSPYSPESPPASPSAPWATGDGPSAPLPEDEPLPARPRPRRTTLLVALALAGGILIAVFALLGRANEQRYLLVCGTDHVSAEQGRSFPPWGSHDMTGPEWKPIPLPPNAECNARETDDLSALGGWYLGMLIERASATLSAKDLLDTLPAAAGSAAPASTAPGPLEVASAELDQALLLARAPEHRDQRVEIERLEGDVAYWRARLRLRDAQAALAEAAKQFDSAAASHPHYATDARAWATFLRELVGELHAGPGGPPAPAAVPPPSGPPAATTTAPPATELPVEPAAGSAAPPAEPAPPIDAGAPGGGVLL